MEKKSIVHKLKAKKQALWVAGAVIFAAGLGYGSARILAPKAQDTPEHKAGDHAAQPKAKPGFFGKIYTTYVEAWESVQYKLKEIKLAELQNDRLKLQNLQLRLQAEQVGFDCNADFSKSKTGDVELKLNAETGAKVGRTLASLQYKAPTNLTHDQLYTLGVSYFKAGENEKAAVIFTWLTGLAGSDAFKTPRNLLMTGVAWYRLDNFETAQIYFDQVLKLADVAANLPYHAQARLWKALSSERVEKHHRAQFWLMELVDYHPQSMEASWVNGPNAGKLNLLRRGTRHVASEHSEHDEDLEQDHVPQSLKDGGKDAGKDAGKEGEAVDGESNQAHKTPAETHGGSGDHGSDAHH